MIGKDHLQQVVKEVYDELMRRADSAKRNSKDYHAPELYIEDQKGYSRGVSEAANSFLSRISKEFDL